MNNTVRVGVVGLVFAAFLAVLGVRLWTLQITEVYAYEERAQSQQVKVIKSPAPRGDIRDVNGVLLAGTRSALALVVDLALVDATDIATLAENVGAFLDEPTSEIVEQLSGPNRGAQITLAEDLTESQATFVLEHRDDFPGVAIIPQPVRTYPLGELAAQVLGYIGRPNAEDLEREDVDGNDFVGRAGVERSYDVHLQGAEGIVEYRVDARRKVLSLEGEVPPVAGSSLVLTIDVRIQEQLQKSLRDGLFQARRLEMEERASELQESPRSERLAVALAQARLDAASESRSDDDAATSEEEVGVDDDDVASDPEPIVIDPAFVLGPLYPGLPIDGDGVCVPIQRVAIPLGGDALLSGFEPRLVRLESIDEVGGELEAAVTISGVSTTVRRNQYVDATERRVLQVLAVSEDQLILYHRDPWCPVRTVGVVLDPNDGSILAMSSFPTYDPTVFVEGLSTEEFGSLGAIGVFQNFAVQGQYAPASTFKVVPYMLAIEENFYPIDRGTGDRIVGVGVDREDEPDPVPLLSDTDLYFCGGEFRFVLSDGTVQRKRDWKWPGDHGMLDLHGALTASCDLYFWDLALRLWQEKSDESGVDKENLVQVWARNFGFGTTSGVDLPFEKSGLIPDRAWFKEEQGKGTGRVREGPWVGGDLMDIAVGQGAVLTTPLQLANGLAAMVNGGTVWQPRVVAEIVNSDGDVVHENIPTVASSIPLDPRTVRMLLDALGQVVSDRSRGTAWFAFKDFGENVALIGGKTGTGEIIKASRAEHFRQVDDALFIGVAPITRPKWVISVVVERGGSGGRVAAPIARQVFQYLLNGPDAVTELAPGLEAD